MRNVYFYLNYTHASGLECVDQLILKVRWSVDNQEIDGAWIAITATVFVPIRVSDAWQLLGGPAKSVIARLNDTSEAA